MILVRILTRDLLRTKGAMVVVFAFITLSALLIAGGTRLVADLNGGLSALFDAAVAPDFVQMHSGEVDREAIDRWAEAQPTVRDHQTVEMITVDNSALVLGTDRSPEENGVMDISFVRQNEKFDYLLNLENEVYEPRRGTVGVPLYYQERDGLQLGDTVTLRTERGESRFIIGSFIRDAQMNPSIVHSKRFVVHDEDYRDLRESFPETEHLIEFLLTDEAETDAFSATYQASGLPKRGPAVDQGLFRTLNALTDGIVAAVVIVLSLLLILIAILCLRFILIASIEEDYREIGVMKAIGMKRGKIRRIYLAKYVAVSGIAVLVGYGASIPLGGVLATNITRYMGTATKTPIAHLFPAVATGMIFVTVVVSSLIILRRFNGISAVQALRSAGGSDDPARGGVVPIKRFSAVDVNVLLGIRDVFQRLRLYGLLAFIFFFAAFTIVVPVHFLATINDPSFISYMGIGRSDIRIDLRQTDGVAHRYDEMLSRLDSDPDVTRFSPLVTSQFTVLRDNGERETIAIETGDFSLFPLDYLRGRAPSEPGEIALSYLNAQDMERDLGDTITLVTGRHGEAREGIATGDTGASEQRLTVTGIYQDVTNGGRTAKAVLPARGLQGDVLWYSVSVDLAPGSDVAAKTAEFSGAFAPARVTDIEGYIAQTLGSTIDRLGMVTGVAIAVGIGISVLITSLFVRMLLSKDRERIAILRRLGFSLRHIRRQYITTALTVLTIGIAAGTLFSNTVGQRLVSVLWSFMGAAQISFVINPLQAYILLPLLLGSAVAITTRSSLTGISETHGEIQ
jgi:putative ABC transport system permease protein